MIVKEYKSLDEVLTHCIKDLLFKDPTTEHFDSISGMNGYVYDLFIKVNSLECSVDLGDYLYTMSKWKQLLKLYVDKEELVSFAEILKSSKSYSQTFYFKQKPRTVGHGNGSCLISMVVTRPQRNKPRRPRCARSDNDRQSDGKRNPGKATDHERKQQNHEEPRQERSGNRRALDEPARRGGRSFKRKGSCRGRSRRR